MIQHKRQLHIALGVQPGMSVTGNNNIHIGNVGVEGLPRSVAVGVYNGDGKQDLAVVNDNSNDVSILLRDCIATYAAQIQQPINVDGTSVFSVRRGVVPVKFTLTDNGTSTCALPAATIALTRRPEARLGPSTSPFTAVLPAQAQTSELLAVSTYTI